MRKNQIIKFLIVLRHIGAVVSKLEIREFIDDENDLFTRECKFAITDNLYIMKSCISYLEENSMEEEELDSLCESFQDYYAKGTKSENEDEEEGYEDEEEGEEYDYETENDGDSDEKEKKKIKEKEKDSSSSLVLVTNKNDTMENKIPVIQTANITQEEAEIYNEVNKVMNTLDEDDYESRIRKNKNNRCKVRVKKWKEKCKDVTHIASIINTSLELFYFRRESYCLKNSKNRYCEVIMNEIQDQAFNGTDNLVIPLNSNERNETCECYKERMTYYRNEYDSSTDPTIQQKRKHYSKNKKKPTDPINKPKKIKRTWLDEVIQEPKKESKKTYTSSVGKLLEVMESMVHRYFPLKMQRHRSNPFPTFNELIQQAQEKKITNSKEKQTSEKAKRNTEALVNTSDTRVDYSDTNTDTDTDTTTTTETDNDTDDIFEVMEQLLLEGLMTGKKVKRMESDVNIDQLRKLITKYNQDMNKFMDITTCNVTFKEYGSRNVISDDTSSSHSQYYPTSFLFLLFLFSSLLYYIIF